MNPNPFSALLHSRKFWLLILDTVLAIAVYFINKYASESVATDAKFLFGALQPMFIAVIVGIFAEDNSQRKLEGVITQAQEWREELRVEESSGDGAG